MTAHRCVHGARRGTHKLPLKADLRTRIDKQPGDTVTVHLTDRIDR
jgi:hypothetical protein